MLIVELSAGQGPAECCEAVALALRRMTQEAADAGVTITVIEALSGPVRGSLQSVSLSVVGTNEAAFARSWQGSMQWRCASRLRPHHGRKNWFFAGAVYEPPVLPSSDGIRIQTMRAGGAGGQHVNKTESAIRATHIASGLSVRVESERSQHANRRLALALLQKKLERQAEDQRDDMRARRRMFHHELERGNPERIFAGERFEPH